VRWDRIGRVALLIVLGVVGLLYIEHAVAYLSARARFDAQGAIVRVLDRDNAALVAQQRLLRDPATIVLDARKLGMVKPGERAYVISGHPGQ
jgi:cell division protein FtsB